MYLTETTVQDGAHTTKRRARSIGDFLRFVLKRAWVLALAAAALPALIGWADLNFRTLAGNLLLYIPLAVIGLVIVHLETRLRDARAMATLDPLTGVFNRTEMQVRVERAIEKARNGGPNLSFIYIDCDRFKEVNDTHGHAFGDHVLRALAGMLQSAVQHQGIVGRMGGDEFVALFEGVSEADARARMQVAELRFTRDMRSLGCHTTMSFGLVPVGAEAMTFQSLLEEADHRMYAQKQEGALAVVSAGDPVRYLPDVGAVLFEEHGFGA